MKPAGVTKGELSLLHAGRVRGRPELPQEGTEEGTRQAQCEARTSKARQRGVGGCIFLTMTPPGAPRSQTRKQANYDFFFSQELGSSL